MQTKKTAFTERDLKNEKLSEKELVALIGDDDIKLFVNAKSKIYKEKNLKEKMPPRKELIKMMSEEPTLIKRPLLVKGKIKVTGYNEEKYLALSGK